MWPPSRRGTVAVLGGGSVLSSPATANILDTAARYLEVGLPFFFLYETLIQAGLVSVGLTWLFLCYIVYAYVPELYPEFYGRIVDRQGFRVLTAVTTGAFGLVAAGLLGAVPDRGPFAAIPSDESGAIIASVVVLGLSTISFSGYVRGCSNQKVALPAFEVQEAFTVRSQQGSLEALEELPVPVRRVVVAINNATVGILFVFPCLLMGIAFVLVGLFSPVPEAAVVATIVFGKLPGPTPGRLRMPGPGDSDIEFRVADQATDAAVQNKKGLVMALFCLLGVGSAGIWFVSMAVAVVTVGPELWSSIGLLRPARVGRLSGAVFGEVVLTLWAAIGVLVVALGFAVYGLWYWFRQLQRLPTYASVWEAHKRSETPATVVPKAPRPRGIFVPGALLLVPVIAAVWFNVIGLWSGLGVGLSWPAVFMGAVWSVHTTERASPSAVTGEGWRVTAALLVQLSVVYAAGVVTASGAGVSRAVLGLLLVLVVGAAYWPDVDAYATGQTGPASYLGWIYLGGLCGCVVAAGDLSYGLPRSLYVIVAGLFILGVVLRVLENSVTTPE